MNFCQKVIRNLSWRIFSLLPKDKNKVAFTSFYGRGYSDSPKAIADELLSRGGYKLYWNVKDETAAKSLPDGITPVKYESIKGIYHMCTAGFWIDNARKYSYTKKGKGQYYVQCWHGFPLKRIEKDAGAEALGEEYIRSAVLDSKMTDLYTSDSKFLTDIYHNAFWYDGKVVEMGLPRNDMLVNPPKDLGGRVRSALGLDSETKLMLYAPTFRKDFGLEVYNMDYKRCTEALSARFGGKWLVLAKLHPNIASKADQLSLDPNYVINASNYPDIHDLYVTADAMITDYSSTMFDFMITRKPCFLYVTDVNAYKNDRNFYFDLEKLPFKRAENNDELCDVISSYSEAELQSEIDRFFNEFGIIESGKASKAVADEMDNARKGMK